MARRIIEQRLSDELKDSEFAFLGTNPIHLIQIYEQVKNRFPDLCDDEYLCSTHCKSGNNLPEWKHVVRGDMQFMKRRGLAQRTDNVGEWIFHPLV